MPRWLFRSIHPTPPRVMAVNQRVTSDTGFSALNGLGLSWAEKTGNVKCTASIKMQGIYPLII